MSFSYSSGVITQTGTDTDLSGLSGLTGVTVTDEGYKKTYYLNGSKLKIDGTLSINPTIERLSLSSTTEDKELWVGSTGTLNVGFNTVVQNGGIIYPQGEAICTNNRITGTETQWQEQFSSIHIDGTLNWYGGTIICGSSFWVDPTSTVNIARAKLVFYPGDNYSTRTDSQPRFHADSSGLSINGLEVSTITSSSIVGFSITTTPANITDLKVSGSSGAGIYGNDDNTNFTLGANLNMPLITLNDMEDISVGNVYNLLIWEARSFKVKNPANGAGFAVGIGSNGNNTSVTRNRWTGSVWATKTLSWRVKNSAGSAVSGAYIYIVDVDNGNRPTSAGLSFFTGFSFPALDGDMEYTWTTDGSGSATAQDVTIFLAHKFDPAVSHVIDYRCQESDGSGQSLASYTWHYNYLLQNLTVDLVGTGELTAAPVLFDDHTLTQTTAATVAAYTTLNDLDQIRDYNKYHKTLNTTNILYPSISTEIATVDGLVLDFGAQNIVFNSAAGSVYAINTGTSTITIKPTTTVNQGSSYDTIKTTGSITGFTGTAKIQSATLDFPTAGSYSGTYIGITADFSATGTFDLTGATITGTIELTNSSGGAVTVQVATGTSYTNTGPSITVQEIGSAPTLTIQADSATATVRYFPDDSQTPGASESDGNVDYVYVTSDPIDIEVVEQGYVPINQQNIVPIDGTLNITTDIDEAYNASHGLTIVTHYTYDRATKAFAILADQNAFDVRSSMADTIRTNSSYYNTPLLLEAKPGGKRIDLIDGATITSMETWKGAGMERYDALGTIYPIEKWYAIQSVQDITGASVIYRQTNSGDFTIGALTGGKFDETLQFYSDTTVPPDNSPETNNNSYLLIKALRVGYRQARNDVVAGNGGASLKADLYTIGLNPESHSYAGNPVTDLSLTMTLVAGGTVGGKTFAYKWVDAGTNSGTDIADWINYKGATDPNGLIPGSTGLRWAEMPDMVIYVTGGVETAQGYREGATPTLVGFYLERGGADHPDMVRAQADDGTYYTPAVTANITITNLPDDVGGNTRLQIYNVTTATEYYNDDPAGTGYSASYTDGVGISSGDQLRIRFAHLNAGTSFEYGQTFVTASSSGFSADGSTFIAADSVYASNGINGSTITNFTADFVEDQIEIASDTDFTAAQAYAFYCYQLTNTTGIGDFWGGVTAIDTGNYRINTSVVSIYFDSPVGVTYSVKQTDTGRIFRSDDAYPVKDPTTSGYGVQLNWKNVVYVQNVGGSALTAAESAALTSIKSKTDSLTFTVAGQVDSNIQYVKDSAITGAGTEADPWGP